MQTSKQHGRSRLSDADRDRLLDASLLPDNVTVGKHKYSVHAPAKAGISGAVWRCRDQHGRDRAIKLATPAHYASRSYHEEITRAAHLDRYTQFARLEDAGVVSITFPDRFQNTYVVFVEEWVDGWTLRDVIDNRPELHTVSFFRAFVDQFCGIIAALEAEGLRHDDLNPGNVMIVPPPKGDLDQAHHLKVVDLASLKPASKPQRKPRDDHRWFVEHLVAIWNIIVRRKTLSIRDRRFLAESEALLRTMLDDDAAVRLTDPAQIRDRFHDAYTRSYTSRRSQTLSLRDPFDFISAEHLWDDRLLVRLFAESCPWILKVTGPDPCLLTGPRGCGKSMIFRWLSLKAQLLAHHDWRADQFDTLAIAGFYISCSTDLQNRFAWIKTKALADRFDNEIVHYFNLLATREVIQTIAFALQRSDSESYWGLGIQQQREVYQFIMRRLDSTAHPHLQGVSLLDQALDLVESHMFSTHTELSHRRNLPRTLGQAFLGDFTEMLASTFPVLRRKRITFLVDDFSVHRLPAPVQVSLNRVIWERRPSHVFKLSSEKYGTVLHDDALATADLSREMVEIDCGQEFMALDDRARQADATRFAKELLDNRLVAAGYRGRTDTLIGPSVWEEGSLGRALRNKPQGRRNDQYHGLECIAGMCSGDISTLLLILRRIFSDGHVTSDTTTCVSQAVQHEAIRFVSQRMLDRIRTYHPHGPAMYDIVTHFGTLVRHILDEGRMIKQGKSEVVPQCPRIEVDQTDGAVPDHLTTTQDEVARELVRRAIFIEMEAGMARHRNVTALRWQLRRVYLPAFYASLFKNDAIKRDPDWFKFFLSNPKEACAVEWRNRRKALPRDGLFSGTPNPQ